ncbi:phage tail protein [Ewingella americana]|nr:phage tail protein [Ewingella americana]
MSEILNDAPLRTVKLGGQLGKLYGKRHKFYVKHPIEALRALKANYDGLEQYLNSSKQRGITYAVFSGKRNLNIDELAMDNGTEDIYIMPVIIGSKRAGMFQTILGAALIVAAYALSVPTAGASMVLVAPGVALAAGGIIQMMSPQPSGLANSQDADNKPSYAFGGPVNTTAQGNPVALLYGRRRIGGAVISAGIFAEDQQ